MAADETPETLRRRIAELEGSLSLPLPDAARQIIEQQLAELRGRQAAPGGLPAPEVQQRVEVSGGYVHQIIAKAVFGPDPREDEARRLAWYLQLLAGRLRPLLLRGLDEQLSHGDGIALPHVYITMAITGEVAVARADDPAFAAYFVDARPGERLRPEHDPDYALPDHAVVRDGAGIPVDRAADNLPIRILYRAQLATEAIATNRRLVLLGAPGSGKSTVLRYLAWALAQRGLGAPDAPTLLGWAPERPALPILLPLRALAGRIEREGASGAVITAALRQQLAEHGVTQADDLLADALSRGVALLMLDGLDEVPLQRVPGQSASRRAVLDAVRSFLSAHHQARAALTCRTRAFDDALRSALGWPVAVVAPLTLGQIRFFIPAWYRELVSQGQLTQARADELSDALLAAIIARPQLRQMAEAPLLLTLMAIVLSNKGEFPRDRPQLYERILELLLGQWDQVRDGASLGQAIGVDGWGSAEIRPLLDRLSYDAHREARSEDGRGRLARSTVNDALIRFFEEAQLPDAWGAAGRCLEYINQRSGLLVPDDAQDSYTFAHLTFQEHCAGRSLVIHRDAISRVMAHRHDDRWREPILLGLGVVQQANPFLIEAVLRRLISRSEDAQVKPPAIWQRDLIFAAEIGKDRDWSNLAQLGVDVKGIQSDLRAGLVELLADKDQPLPVAERVRAGTLLGELGDPRFPVTTEGWREQLARRDEGFGAPAGYWCYVPGGSYRIGGWGERTGGDPGAGVPVALQPFWVARFPITVAQFAPFVAEGYGPGAERWWTPEGWCWRQNHHWTMPWGWGNSDYRRANQPVIGITWHETMAYCVWLSDHLARLLPPGYVVRLPTEAEWEAAAAYDEAGQRRTYPWGEADPVDDLAISNAVQIKTTAPVGCCAAGAAACGALDLAGNVWELTASDYRVYPARSHELLEDWTSGQPAWRGGSWDNDRTATRCGARVWYRVRYGYYNFGFRVVLAAPLPRGS